jgi:hypothetical protein
MLKPSKNPATGENPRKKMAIYYDLGKMFFSTNAEDKNNSEYKNPLKEKNQVPIDFSGIKENNFEFLKLLVEMKPLYEIEEYKGEKFILLSEKETEDYTVFCLFVSRYSCQKTFLLKGYLDEGCDF